MARPKVENLELLAVAAAIDHEQIGRFDIAVHDAPGMRGGQSTRRLLTQGEYLRRGEAVVGEIELERLASQQLHYQVRLSVLFADVVDGADVGMVQGGRRPGLAQEALMGKVDPGVRSAGGRRTAGARIGAEKAVGDELESDFAFESGVQRAINVTHTAGANLFYDSVGPKDSSRSDHRRPKRLDSRPQIGRPGCVIPEFTGGEAIAVHN